jgi:2-polyprenyl-6-methoxyphenol hydroxylase-like FAD-dependent oxidoreductase
MPPTVLISGASVAGPVVAYWLSRCGFRPTVVERTSALRIGGGGHAVDLFGPAVEIADRMGVLEAVQAARTRTEVYRWIRPGHHDVEVDAAGAIEGVSDRHIEIMRGDLAQILYEAGRDEVEYLFGDSISALHDIGELVEVSFEHAPTRTFDLVIGADGLHSNTRRLTFGDETQFTRFLGGYLAVATVPNYLGLDRQMLALTDVDRIVAIYPVQDARNARVLFLFRGSEHVELHHDDPASGRRVVTGIYGGLGWEVPRLLSELAAADDLYADSITQIRMDTWSKGRITLVGDAGYSPGPAVGGGTSLAVIGAYVLATELGAAGADHLRGLRAYEAAMRDVVRHSQTIGPATMAVLIPHTRAQIWALAEGMRLLPRLPLPIRRKLTAWGGGPAAMLNSVVLRDPPPSPRSGAK